MVHINGNSALVGLHGTRISSPTPFSKWGPCPRSIGTKTVHVLVPSWIISVSILSKWAFLAIPTSLSKTNFDKKPISNLFRYKTNNKNQLFQA